MKWNQSIGLSSSLLAILVACSSETTSPTPRERDKSPGIGQGNAPPVQVAPAPGDGDGDEAPVEGSLEVCAVEGVDTRGLVDGSWRIDDFEDGNESFFGNGLSGGWYGFGDGTGSQNTEPQWLPSPGGRGESAFAAHIVGGEYSDWGSGNGLVLGSRSVGDDCLFDASAYDGFTFWMRGSVVDTFPDDPLRQPYANDDGFIKVQAIDKDEVPFTQGGNCDELSGSCWDSHRVRIVPTECWVKYVVPFVDMDKDGYGQHPDLAVNQKELLNLGFEIGRYMNYDYWIDDLQFYAGEPPESEEDCSNLGAGGAGGSSAN